MAGQRAGARERRGAGRGADPVPADRGGGPAAARDRQLHRPAAAGARPAAPGRPEANGWNRQKTAEQLDINRTTLYKKIKQYGLEAYGQAG
ncbi:MAG: helix-turn-helix domain-containing protein [Planctomycetota bacterium]